MGRTYDTITPALATFIEAQHMFFVASAPSVGGHVNVSPKGLDSLRILDDHRVAYLDLTGSGIETISHIRDNGRLTIMFCAVEGPPRIVRLSGTGTVVAASEPAFAELAARFPAQRGARAVILLDVERIADSCGFSVPRYEFVGDRDVLDRWTDARSDEQLRDYRLDKNGLSIDGLPGWDATDERA